MIRIYDLKAPGDRQAECSKKHGGKGALNRGIREHSTRLVVFEQEETTGYLQLKDLSVWTSEAFGRDRTEKGPFSFQSQRKAMPKNAQTKQKKRMGRERSSTESPTVCPTLYGGRAVITQWPPASLPLPFVGFQSP